MKKRAQVDDNFPTGSHYVIRVRGTLDDRWAEWFSGIKISRREVSGNVCITTLDCPAVDQAQLRGILNRIWDLNLSLLSVQWADDPRTNSTAPDAA